MGLVKNLLSKNKKPKLRETRLGIASFVCALVSLAHINFILMTNNSPPIVSKLLFPIFPMTGIFLALLSLTRVQYKKTYTWLAFGIYAFIAICMFAIFIFAYSIYPKP